MAFPTEPDEGQPGLAQLPDGRFGYRYTDSNDVIIMKRGPEFEGNPAPATAV